MANAVVTDVDIEALRFHLGYGNLGVAAYPYAPDGFVELFHTVIQPNLSTAPETTATTAIAAGEIVQVTPVSMTGIAVNVRLLVDNGEDAEEVVVKATTVTKFSARFSKAHAASGYPILVASGVARLRQLLHAAQLAHEQVTGSTVTSTAGLKSVGRGEVEWFGESAVLESRRAHYLAIVAQLSSLVRVAPVEMGTSRGGTMEAY
jgi:hypothetical protein